MEDAACIVFVDWRCFLSWSRCPLPVGMDFGRCFFIKPFVNPGNDARNPLSMAASRVDMVGKPSEA